jgi:hypothetical protein
LNVRILQFILDENGLHVLTRIDIIGSVRDNCTPTEKLIIETLPPVLDCRHIGQTIKVTVTVTDEAGNSTVCEASVTVLDNIPPEPLCRDITVYLNENGLATIKVEDIDNGSFDNCGLSSLSLDKTVFDCNNLGENRVRLIARDTSGNTEWCYATVTVIDDRPPVAICRSIDVRLGPDGRIILTPTMVDNNSYDECGIQQMRLSRTVFTCNDVGENIVTLYVTDPFGNIDSCTAIINIIGNLPPVANDDIVKALANQNNMILPLNNDTDPNGRT